MPKLRPIIRETYASEENAAYELAVHSHTNLVAPSTPSVTTTNVPTLTGTKVGRALGGASYSPRGDFSKFR